MKKTALESKGSLLKFHKVDKKEKQTYNYFRSSPAIIESEEDINLKHALILLCLVGMVLTCAGCAGTSKLPDRELPTEPAQTPAVQEESIHSPVTSRDAELYIDQDDDGNSIVVNQYGVSGADYAVDQSGNIVTNDGAIIVSRENTERFKNLESFQFDQEVYSVSLDPLNLPIDYYYNGQYTQYTVPFHVKLRLADQEATNQIILIESSNAEVASVQPNQNAEIIANGKFSVEPGCLAIQPVDPSESLDVVITARMVGDATITARALSGYASAQCEVHVEFGEGDKTGVPESWLRSPKYSSVAHVHLFTPTVTKPTIWNEGFTEYKCEECGHSFRGDYTPNLVSEPDAAESAAHQHDYTASTVAPTESERGYTLYVCEGCGDSYKANYVDPVSK